MKRTGILSWIARPGVGPLSVFLLLLAIPIPGETISVTPGYVEASTPGLRATFDEALAAAVANAGRASEENDFRLLPAGRDPQSPETTISVTAIENPEDRYIVLSVSEGPAAASSLMLRAPWDEVLPQLLTQGLLYFEPAMFGYPEPASSRVVQFIDEFPLDGLRPPNPTHSMLGLYPMGLTTTPNGNLVVAGSTFAVEVDPLFRVESFPGVDLLDAGNYGYARAVGATPAGTLYLQPAQGTDIYRIIPGAGTTQRVRQAAGGFGPLVVLPDGGVVTIDTVAKRAILVSGRERRELPLFTHPDAFISAAAPGPAGNIWTFEAVERRILIHSPEGRLVDSIVPAIPASAASQAVGIAPYLDGSFVLLTREGLWKVARDGRPEWSLPTIPDGRESGFLQTAAVAVDSESGFIYIADSQRRNLVRLLDKSWDPTTSAPGAAGRPGSTPGSDSTAGRAPEHQRLAEVNARLAAGEDPQLLAEKARLYTEIGAAALAEATWRYVLDLDPFNSEAQTGLEEVEFARLARQAERADAEARETLSRLGPASARGSYLQALQLYEQLLAIRPSTPGAREQMESLQRAFTQGGGEEGSDANPLFLDGIAMENVFPSLFSAYRNRPVGSVRVVNRGDTPLEGIRAEVSVRRYSDFPTVTELPGRLAPGESRELPLRLVFNTNVFEVEEDLPMQASIRVIAASGRREHVVERSSSFTMHRRTAITWIETERLGAFITPNEANITRFALLATATQGDDPGGSRSFSRQFLRAARIVDALGLYQITYVEDPRTPISDILGRRDVVDTVRLPRTTLLNRAGDCDDTSALVASLLEAAGIATAIVTTPDHVLIAFDTGEPASNAWVYENAGLPVFEEDGNLFLPVETTVLDRGFVGAVEAAARRIANSGGVERAGFVPTGVAQEQYPTIPVPATELNLAFPREVQLQQRTLQTTRGLLDSVYEPALASLESDGLGRSSGSGGDSREAARRAVLLSRIGSLHSRFGMARAARESFRQAMEAAPVSPVPAVHFATHLLASKEPGEAIEVLRPAADRYPEALLIRALLARSYLDAGRASDAESHIEIVNARAPALAQRYAISRGNDGTRASGAFDPALGYLPVSEEEVFAP